MGDQEVPIHGLHPDFGEIHPGAEHAKMVYTAATNTRELKIPSQGTLRAGDTPGLVQFTTHISEDLVLDRTFLVQYTIEAVVTGGASAGAGLSNFAKTNSLCLASYPIQRACNSVNVKLNNNSLNIDPSTYISALNWTHDAIEIRRLGQFPSQPDNFNTVQAMAIKGGGARLNVLTGASSQATLAVGVVDEGESCPDSPFSVASGYDQPRNIFPPSSITYAASGAGAAATYTIRWIVTEPLIHPFCRLNDTRSMLARVSYVDVQMNFSNLKACLTSSSLCLANFTDTATNTALTGRASANIAVQFAANTSANLLLRTHVPTIIPRQVVSLPYTNVLVRTEPVIAAAGGALNPGGTGTVTTRSYTFAQVPHKMYLFAKPRGAPYTTTEQADAFLRIDSLTFQTDRDQGGLASSDPAQLHQMSARNGLNMPYNKWRRDVGSIVVLDFTKGDVGGWVAGMRGNNFTFNINASFTNTQYNVLGSYKAPVFNEAATAATFNTDWDFYVVALMDARMILDGTGLTLVEGDSQELLAQTLETPPIHVSDPGFDSRHFQGGNGFTRFMKGLGHGIGQALGVVRQGLGAVKEVRGLLGRGLDYDTGAGIMTGGMVKRIGGVRTLA